MTSAHSAWHLTAEPVDVELEPIGLDPHKGAGEDQGVLETARGRRNRIRLGAPRYRDYIGALVATSPQLPADIEAELKNGYDFHEVQPTLSLLPDHDCSFVAVEFGIGLEASKEGEECGPPTTWDLEPREIVRELRYHESSSSGIKLSGEAAARPARLLAELTKGSRLY